eukprot:CAMPEP_0175463262 /NCGR_PEP_ID=MMETSP0095-20121207/69110_1 /TAXON_ID=311494 /ORGANISM="Alexandrium monilatum, Strain CCMP3105" /LENGTH=49 /DNA_ID= /DNA_START= /DNA_END= /DNA_ORIENTATION=
MAQSLDPVQFLAGGEGMAGLGWVPVWCAAHAGRMRRAKVFDPLREAWAA